MPARAGVRHRQLRSLDHSNIDSVESCHANHSVCSAPFSSSALAVAVNAQQRPDDPGTPTRPPRAICGTSSATIPKFAPDRHEGDGPFQRLVIRGATLIDGTGGPPRGPVDIVVEGNRITDIASVGVPHVPSIRRGGRRRGAREIDATGMYVMPGIVDLHVHQGTPQKAPESEYYNKLWLAHGITTVRGVPFASFAYSVHEKERSAKNEIAAPRYVVYQRPGTGWGQGPVTTPEQARAWVRWIKAHGADGLKLGAERPDLMAALLDEAKKLNMGSTAHLQQTGVGHDERRPGDRVRLADRDALLRSVRVDVRQQLRAAVSRRPELQRRAGSLRPGGAAVESRHAAQREVEAVPEESEGTRRHARSDVQHLSVQGAISRAR